MCDNIRGTQLNKNTFSSALGFLCWFFSPSNFVATDRPTIYKTRFGLPIVNSIFSLTEPVSDIPFMTSLE